MKELNISTIRVTLPKPPRPPAPPSLAPGTALVLESLDKVPKTPDQVMLGVYSNVKNLTALHQRLIDRRLKTLFDLGMAAKVHQPPGAVWFITGHGRDTLNQIRARHRSRA